MIISDMHRIILILLIVISAHCSDLPAMGTIAFKGMMGFSSAKFSAGEIYDNKPLGGKLFIRPELDIYFQSINIAALFYFQGIFGSSYGVIPLSGLGGGALYYPAGLPLRKASVENDTSVTRKQLAPFIGVSMGLANLAISDTANNRSLGAVFIEAMGLGGVDYPVSESWIIGIDLAYSLSFTGSTEIAGRQASFKGMYFTFHLTFVPD